MGVETYPFVAYHHLFPATSLSPTLITHIQKAKPLSIPSFPIAVVLISVIAIIPLAIITTISSLQSRAVVDLKLGRNHSRGEALKETGG